MRPAKWRKLLADPNVRRWYENLARGSQLTATDRLRLLARYLEHHHQVYRNDVLVGQATTDNNGFYRITNLPTQATLRVEVTKACYEWNPQYTQIPPGGTVTLDFYATWQCE